MQEVYWPNVSYDALIPGAAFTIREGSHIVGFSTIIRRNRTENPPKEPRTPQLGTAAGQVWMSDDFDDPLPEFEEYR